MQTLQARLNELEADNALLHQANDEAATLLETLAPENAELKHELNDVSQTLNQKVKELEQLRQKHDEDKTDTERLKRTMRTLRDQVNDQEAKIMSSSEMEQSLRQTILNLRRQSKQHDIQGWPLLSLLSFYHDVPPEDPPLSMLSSIGSLHIILTKFIFPSRLSFPIVAHPLVDAFESAEAAIRQVVDWLLSASIKQQFLEGCIDSAIIEHVDTLYKRIMSSISDVINPSFPVTCAAPMDVQIGLIKLSVETLDAHTSTAKSGQKASTITDERFIRDVHALMTYYRQHQQKIYETSKTENTNVVPKEFEHLLEEKQRAVDDASVRCQAFEEALIFARSQLDDLREKFAASNKEKADDKLASALKSESPTNAQAQLKSQHATDDVKDISEQNRSGDENLKGHDEIQKRTTPSSSSTVVDTSTSADKQSEGITMTQHIRTQTNWKRLRGCYLRGALGDLHSSDVSHADENEDTKNIDATRSVIIDTLHRARLAAANAHIVKLDPDSLNPSTCGTTMSRRAIIESISAASRVLPKHPTSWASLETNEVELMINNRHNLEQSLKTMVGAQLL